MNAVPTGVVKGPDGAYYMSQLTGFPFPVRGAKVFRVDPATGAYTTYASGFTMAMDLDFGRDGTLYVLEIDSDTLLAPGTEGAIWAVPPGGGTPQRVELPAGHAHRIRAGSRSAAAARSTFPTMDRGGRGRGAPDPPRPPASPPPVALVAARAASRRGRGPRANLG